MDKQWYLSKTIWGAIIGFVAFILAKYGYIVSSEQGTQIVDLIVTTLQAGGALIGIILVIYGRIKAGREIKSLRLEVKRLNARP
jgi:hypothetical protein